MSELGKKDSVDRMADVALNAIDKLEKENADLRGKLETTEKRLEISPYGDDKIDELEQAFSFMKFERDELSAKIGQLELQVMVMRVALEKALYDLTTSHNLLATDRPDLMPKPDKDITWMTDNSKGIDAINKTIKQFQTTIKKPYKASARKVKWRCNPCKLNIVVNIKNAERVKMP